MPQLPEPWGTFVEGIALITKRVVECEQTCFALLSALTNQPGIDRPRLAQDFRTALRMAGASVDAPSDELESFMKVLDTPNERTPQFTLAERLIRSGVLQPKDSPEE